MHSQPASQPLETLGTGGFSESRAEQKIIKKLCFSLYFHARHAMLWLYHPATHNTPPHQHHTHRTPPNDPKRGTHKRDTESRGAPHRGSQPHQKEHQTKGGNAHQRQHTRTERTDSQLRDTASAEPTSAEP